MSKQTFIFLLTVFVAVLIAWQFFWPAFNNVSLARSELKYQQEKLTEAQSFKVHLEELKEKYSKMSNEVERVGEAIPQNQDIPSLLVQLEAMTSQSGLILNSVDFISTENQKAKTSIGLNQETESGTPGAAAITSRVAPAAKAKTLGIALNLSGSYESLKNFLKAAEKSLRLMDVSSIDFGAGNPGTSLGETGNMLTFMIKFDVYYR